MNSQEMLEIVMTREVRTLYLNAMRNDYDFHRKPFFDIGWFKKHYATVAHRHGIYHGDSHESRNQYNMYFRLVRDRVSATIKRLAENEVRVHPPLVESVQLPPRQLDPELPLPSAEESRQRLKRLRDELAARIPVGH